MLINFGVVGLERGLCNRTMRSIKFLGFIGWVCNGVEIFGKFIIDLKYWLITCFLPFYFFFGHSGASSLGFKCG
jgi:hypothetical protein